MMLKQISAPPDAPATNFLLIILLVIFLTSRLPTTLNPNHVVAGAISAGHLIGSKSRSQEDRVIKDEEVE